jgi:hypothetical protein
MFPIGRQTERSRKVRKGKENHRERIISKYMVSICEYGIQRCTELFKKFEVM